jgi:hypothetical protein
VSTRLSILDDHEKKILEEINEEQYEIAHPSIIHHNCINLNNGKTMCL